MSHAEHTESVADSHLQRELAASALTFAEVAQRALASGNPNLVAYSDIERAMTAAVNLYAAKTDLEGIGGPPISASEVTPTAVVVVASEMIRAANLNLFDLAMWFRRSA